MFCFFRVSNLEDINDLRNELFALKTTACIILDSLSSQTNVYHTCKNDSNVQTRFMKNHVNKSIANDLSPIRPRKQHPQYH